MSQPVRHMPILAAPTELEQLRDNLMLIHVDRIQHDLKYLGADRYDLALPETHALPYIIHPNEQILGIVYGRYVENNGALVGRGALVATDKRVLLVDKKPVLVKCDEITYRVVSGVTYSRVGPTGNVTLHTRVGEVRIRTFNQRCAKSFVEAVEAKVLNEPGANL